MFEKNNYELIFGNAYDELWNMSENSVHCICTSPPYFSLRNYETEHQIWGGFPFCKHEWQIELPRRDRSKNDKKSTTGIQNNSSYVDLVPTASCTICKAWKGELGLEPTPELFVKNLVSIFKQAMKVLREDGILFVNMGDTSWNNAKTKHPFLKEKDMCLVPQRLAIAMQESGWYVRNEIIWNRLNSPPESVDDRFTRNHETVWMFTKSKHYYFDQDSTREAHKQSFEGQHPLGAKKRTVWPMAVSSEGNGHIAPFCRELPETVIKTATSDYGCCAECGKQYRRNYESNEGICIDKGWKKDCNCVSSEVAPCIVLDPFSGSGSTGEVAMQMGRRYIGIELNQDYYDDSIKRFNGNTSLF